MTKRIISIILIISMVMPLLPTFTLQVSAETEDIGSMNALDALGIDTSIMPEGYDENSTSNPYGRNTVKVNPVYELFETGVNKTSSTSKTETIDGVTTNIITNTFSLENILYGNNKPLKLPMTDFYNQGTKITKEAYKEIINTPGTTAIQTTNTTLAATASASGNFIGGNTTDRTGQVATVGAGSMSKNGGLYLYFTDPITGSMSGMKELLNTTAIIGNSGNKMDENFAESPYLMQNYLKIITGDFDNNGIDEVAVYIAEQGKSRVEIYKLETTSSITPDFYLTESNWKKAWTYYFNESPYVSNMVSLASGDFNRDGTDDIAMTWGYYYGIDKNNAGQAVVLYGNNENMLQEKRSIDLNYNTASIVRAAFTYGDIDGDNVNDLILGGQLATDIADGNLNTRFLAIYNYDGDNDKFFISTAKNFNLFEKKKDNSYVHTAMASSGNNYYSSPASVTNIASVNMNGLGKKAYIYMDSLLFEYGDQGLVIKMALDQNSNFNKNISNSQKYYIEYGVVAADFTGDAKETLQVMQYYLPAVKYTEVTIPLYLWWWFHHIHTIVSEELPGELNMLGIYGNDTTITANRRANLKFSTSFCKLNTDQDTVLLKYKNKHYVTYSDPKVLAVLASAPYFADLDNDQLSGSYMEAETSYSSSTGGGTGESSSNTLNIGAYMSFEHDFEVFGVTVAKVEAELAYNHGWTWEMANSSTLEQTITYSTVVGSDSVAFYSIPIETYVYESLVPIIDGSGNLTRYDTQYMSVNIPHIASVKVLPLETYEKIAADYSELPQISGNILTHTVGDPSTYPSSKAGFSNAIEYTGDWSSVNYGGGSITQEIAMTSETEKSYTNTNTIETKVGAGPGDFVFGVSAGYEHGSSQITITTSGSSFTGQIYNMPYEAEPYNYGYAWKIFSYTYSDGGNSFPVVSYLVTDVTAPPKLPTNFQQNTEGTTQDKVKLTWSYSGAAAGFQIYRYYLFPDGSGSYELAFVPASNSIGADINTGAKYYEYIDMGLDVYTDYDYQIQVVGTSVPTESILSPIYTARTKVNKGYPNISLNGLVDGKLLVYPDTNSTVSAVINNSSDYTQTPRYQWQKLTDGVWTDISGAINASYTFKSAGIGDEGQYRCRINAIYEGYYISAYSKTFKLEYSKRTPIAVTDSFTVGDVINGSKTVPKISISLKSAHANHYYVPSGDVIFTVSGSDYNRSFPVALTPSSVSGEANASITLDSQLPDGAYEITAYYSGSRVYKSLTTENPINYLSGSGSGYVLTLNSRYIYGDNILPVLKRVQKIDGITTTDTITDGISYKVYEYGLKLEPVYYMDKIIWNRLVPYKFENSSLIIDGAVSAAKTGNFSLATIVGGLEVAYKDFTVESKKITIGINNQEGTAGDAALTHPTSSILKLINGSTLAYSEEIANLGLAIKAINTAGTGVTISSTTDPGYYTITGIAGVTAGTKYSNYSISFVSGTYILTGPKYSVTGVAKQLNSKVVGDIKILTPEGNDNVNWTKTYANGTTLVFLAKPYIGYDVKDWTITENSTGNVIATGGSSSTLSHLMKSENITVTADFEVAQKTLVYQTVKDTGIVECTSSTVMQSGAVAKSGAEFTFKATPAVGYHFVEWQLTEMGKSPTKPIGTSQSDGSNTCQIAMGTGNTVLYAIFVRDSYKITLQGDLQASYLDDTDNNITTPDELVIVASGMSINGDKVVTATHKPGFSIESGAVWTKDGIPVTTGVSGDNQSYTFKMLKDTAISVKTLNEHYGVIYNVEGPGNLVNKVSVAVNGITTNNLSNIAGGSSIVFSASPAYGYAFDKWIVNGVDDTSPGSGLNIVALGGELNVRAVFKDNTSYNVSVSHGLRGSISYTLNGGESIQIASGGVIPVFKGDKVILTAKPEDNFMVENWKIDSVVKQTTIKTQTFTDISANINVEVAFGAQSYSTVTYKAIANGNITSAKSDGVSFGSGDNSIGNGSTLEFKATPEPGYMVEKWIYNGNIVKNDYNKTLVDTTFTIAALSGDADIEVSFKGISMHIMNIVDEGTNTVTSAVYLPEFEGSIRDGAAAIFTVTPKDGYRVTSVLVGITGEVGLGEFDKVTKGNDGKWICAVNAVTNDLTITAKAKEIYDITIPAIPTGGVITLSTYKAIEGENVTLTATATSSNYVFNSWTVLRGDTGANVELSNKLAQSTTFNMPMSDVTIAATFTHKDNGGDLGGGGFGGGAGSAPVVPEPTEPKYSTQTDGTVLLTLNDVKDSIPESMSKKLIELSKTQDIIISGNNMRIVIPAGIMKIGDDINDIIPDKLTNDGGPGQVVVYTDENGNRHIVQWSAIDKDGISFVIKNRGKYEIIDNSKIFEDIDGHWGRNAIVFVTARELFMGTRNNEFSANEDMTRAMLVTVLHRLNGLTLQKDENFSDVPSGQWYSDAIEWAAANKIVSGYGNGSFGTNYSITREQLVTILYRYTDTIGFDRKESGSLSEFKDGDKVSDYATEAMEWAIGAGLINGRNGGRLDPKGDATRAEVANVLEKFIEMML